MKSVEIMVPAPWFMEMVALLNENPGLDVGVHLVLTSEWDNIKSRPLTDGKSFVDENGYYYPMVWPGKHFRGRSLSEQSLDLNEVEAELRAQIELAKGTFLVSVIFQRIWALPASIASCRTFLSNWVKNMG